MQPIILSASYNHFWRCASHVFTEFLWWVPRWGSYLEGASSMFSLFMVNIVYPNIEDVNLIASRIFAAVLKRPLDGQYYCSILYCAICFSPDGSILCSLFHIAPWVRSSKRVGWHLSCLYGRCFSPLLKKEQGRMCGQSETLLVRSRDHCCHGNRTEHWIYSFIF